MYKKLFQDDSMCSHALRKIFKVCILYCFVSFLYMFFVFKKSGFILSFLNVNMTFSFKFSKIQKKTPKIFNQKKLCQLTFYFNVHFELLWQLNKAKL